MVLSSVIQGLPNWRPNKPKFPQNPYSTEVQHRKTAWKQQQGLSFQKDHRFHRSKKHPKNLKKLNLVLTNVSDLHSGNCFQSAGMGITLKNSFCFTFGKILLVCGLRGVTWAEQMGKKNKTENKPTTTTPPKKNPPKKQQKKFHNKNPKQKQNKTK